MKKRLFSKWFIVPVILITMSSTFIVGRTWAYFNDQETSIGNTSTGWTSTAWTQTTKTDFDAGVLNNVDTSSSPNDVKLSVKSNWYNTAWSRRVPVTINNPGSGLTDYQVKVQVAYDSDMQADFDDIRFTQSDGTTLVNCWRESYTLSTSAIFWAKVQSIPSGSSTVYMYYGNAAVNSTSDGTATFNFFDDFSGGLGKWTIDAENTDKVSITTGAGNPSPSLRHDPDSSQTKNSYFDTRLITKDYKMLDGIIEYEVYLAGTPRIIHQLGWRVQSLNFENGYCWRLQTLAADGGPLRFTGITSWTPFGTAFNYVSANTWHSVKEIVSGSTYTGYVDGGSAYSGTDSTKLTSDYLISHVHGVSLNASSYVLVDNIRVRQYASPEPTTAFGSEEGMYVSSGTIASQVLDTNLAGSGWDGLVWDKTLPASTSITFEVRASDTPFLKTDASPSWTSVGSTSPVISSLPSERYKQWRATLTPDGARTSTPTLQEIRLYYYGG